MPSQASILLVTWPRDPLQQHGFSAPFEASLAAQLFKRLAWDPDGDTIITFYGAQRQMVLPYLPCNSACKSVDGSQGSVVEGFLDRAVCLILFLSPV